MLPIQRVEWRWVSICAVVAAALVAAPYCLALLHPPDGRLLARTLYYGNDLSQYFAAMGDGATSALWHVQDHLTAEPHRPAFMYPFYVLLGKIAGSLGLQAATVFGAAVALAVPALVFAAYGFVAAFLDSVGARRVAFLLIMFGSGLSIWVASAVTPVEATVPIPRTFSFDRAEVSTLLLPFGPPHLTLALAAIMLWGRALARWSWGARGRSLAIVALCVAAVGLLNPFTLGTLVVLSGGYAAVRWAADGRFPLREAGAAAVVALSAAPLLGANLLTFALDPFWSLTYGRQNTTASPPPWTLLLDFGLLVPLALVGAVAPKFRPDSRALLVFWVLALLASMYLPVPFQRRFGFGLQPALAVLAGIGIVRLEEAFRSRRALLRTGFRAALVVGVLSATVLSYALLVMAATGNTGLGATVFEPRSNVEAGAWLSGHSGATDVVLASPETGNYLAGVIRGRVVAGHGAGTLNYPAKEALVKSFFRPSAPPSERRDLAAEAGATLVFLGARERALGGTALDEADGFRVVYDADGVQIYRVERPAR